LEIGDLGDGQRLACAGNVDVDLGPGEVKARRVCVQQGTEHQGTEQEDGSDSSSDA